MKNVVLGSMLALALVASTANAASRIVCRGGDVSISVDVDVLESNPPQSSISVKRNGQDWGSYSAFTDYREMETFPVQYYWGFKSHDGTKSLVVSTTQPQTRGPRKATGAYTYNKATSPIRLTCSLY